MEVPEQDKSKLLNVYLHFCNIQRCLYCGSRTTQCKILRNYSDVESPTKDMLNKRSTRNRGPMTKDVYENIWKFLKGNPDNDFATSNRKFVFDQGSHAYPIFSLGISSSNEEVLYKVVRGKKKVAVYKEQAQDIIRKMHCPNGSACTSVGARRLEKTFSATYFINDARQLVQDTLDKCTGTCKLMKSFCTTSKPVHTSSIMERVQIDLLQMYGPKSALQYESSHKFRFIFTVMDWFSKYCWLISLKSKQAIEVANGLGSIFKQFGCPHILHSDNGGEFVSHVTEILCSKSNIKVVHGRPYHPQSQDQVENLNKRVKRAVVSMLLKFKKDQAKVWPSLLNDATNAKESYGKPRAQCPKESNCLHKEDWEG